MDTYWVPGVNHLGSYGRWAFAEFADVYQIESDFSDKVEVEFAKLIESASGREFTPLTPAQNRSEALVARQFGQEKRLIDFTQEVWKRIGAKQDRSLHLSDLQAAAERTSCSTQDALAIISLLSSETPRLLNMDMRFTNGKPVSREEFIQKLSDWWRDGKVSDADWEQWALQVEVRWTPAGMHEGLL